MNIMIIISWFCVIECAARCVSKEVCIQRNVTQGSLNIRSTYTHFCLYTYTYIIINHKSILCLCRLFEFAITIFSTLAIRAKTLSASLIFRMGFFGHICHVPPPSRFLRSSLSCSRALYLLTTAESWFVYILFSVRVGPVTEIHFQNRVCV